ncbi:MAG: HTTM domain-containing protein [Myxococcota bacterium]|nr:HTTM domain-containing protein [Myxococcota bacterium]
MTPKPLSRWQRWVALWDHKEHPRVLGTIRILLGLVLLYDFLYIWHLGLVEPLFAPHEIGGISNVMERPKSPLIYEWFPESTATAWGLQLAICTSALLFTVGLFTRLSGAILLLCLAQSAQIVPLGDRGIDLMVRNVLFLLLFSQCGAWASLDARRKTGRFSGDGSAVSAWPRHLLIVQLVVMYFTAGVQKVGMDWMPMGGFAALFVVLQDPAVARADFSWLSSVYPITQLASATTMLFEWLAPFVLLTYHFRNTPGKTSRLRTFYRRFNPHYYWIGIGVLLHLGIALTLALGIFPYAMLALYPAFFHPDEWQKILHSIAGRFGNSAIQGHSKKV